MGAELSHRMDAPPPNLIDVSPLNIPRLASSRQQNYVRPRHRCKAKRRPGHLGKKVTLVTKCGAFSFSRCATPFVEAAAIGCIHYVYNDFGCQFISLYRVKRNSVKPGIAKPGQHRKNGPVPIYCSGPIYRCSSGAMISRKAPFYVLPPIAIGGRTSNASTGEKNSI